MFYGSFFFAFQKCFFKKIISFSFFVILSIIYKEFCFKTNKSVWFYVQKTLLKFFYLELIIFFIILDYFDVLISKIKKYYFNTFLNKKYFKK